MSEECLFCKIANGQIPSENVYEDDSHIAFMDIRPANLGHVLILPKQHYHCLADMPDEAVASIFVAAARVAKATQVATGAPGFNLMVNNGAEAGQVVFHTHIHAIPRFKDDGHKSWNKKEIAEEKTKATAEEIKRLLGLG